MFAYAATENNQMSDAASSSPLFISRQNSDLPPVVLIVEDDEDNRLMLKIMLEMWNYRVIEAENGEEAIALARTHRPNLILMDLKMQLLSGLEATRQIRRSTESANVPIIFVSGCAEAGFRRSALEAGGNEYLVKPIVFEHLQKVISGYIGEHPKSNRTISDDGN